MWTKARWTNGKKIITGSWTYYKPADRFDIVLDSTDKITGQQRTLSLLGDDSPEWDKWKLMEEKDRG